MLVKRGWWNVPLIVLVLGLPWQVGCATAGNGSFELSSTYVSATEGVKLAVDVALPKGRTESLPAIVMFTRYWRRLSGGLDQGVAALYKDFTEAGYAVVTVDVRGTGASFGSRETEWPAKEIEDYSAIVDWIAGQVWSNGRVASLGTSYLANSAELAAVRAPVGLVASVPRFSDFDVFRDAAFLGGVPNEVILTAWGTYVRALDVNDFCGVFASEPACDGGNVGVAAVDSDERGTVLARAIEEHAANLDVAKLSRSLVYSDQPFHVDGQSTMVEISPFSYESDLEAAGIPAYHWAGWLDGATAKGALSRFMTFDVPMMLVIGPWNHGASHRADPFASERVARKPLDVAAQYEQIRAFLDPLVQGHPVNFRNVIKYFTYGSNAWRETSVWPPPGVVTQDLFLRGGRTLRPAPPREGGVDEYTVDWQATTGTTNRWHTQLGGPVYYGDRRSEAERLLTYTSAPIETSVEITGSPILEVYIASSRSDGAFHAYLELVDADGVVTYVTEGALRAQHRAVSDEKPPYRMLGPYRTYNKKEAAGLQPGHPSLLEIELLPTSIIVPAGHRIRISLAGADSGSFRRIPESGSTPRWQVFRSDKMPSRLRLPVRVDAATVFQN